MNRVTFHSEALKEGFEWLGGFKGWWSTLGWYVAFLVGAVLPQKLSGFPAWASALIVAAGVLAPYGEGAYRVRVKRRSSGAPGSGGTVVTGGTVNIENAQTVINQALAAPESGGEPSTEVIEESGEEQS